MNVVIGVDPGASGAIVYLSTQAGQYLAAPGLFVSFIKTCETEADLWTFMHGRIAAHAFIERVHSMPKQGVSSSFKFGQSYGFLRGLLVASGIPFEEVTPQAWQKAMGCMSKGDKNVTKARAQQLFPGVKVTHANADAMLIAEYGRRALSGRRGALHQNAPEDVGESPEDDEHAD